MTRIATILMTASLWASCGRPVAHQQTPPHTNHSYVIRHIEDLMGNDTCNNVSCDLVTVETPKFRDDGRSTIMIIDSGMVLPALTLYANRVLGIYRENPDTHSYEVIRPSIKIPKIARTILIDILGQNQSVASSIGFHKTSKVFTKKYLPIIKEANSDRLIDHGGPSFNILAELNPASDFVIIQLNESDPSICNMNKPGGLTQYKTFWQKKAQRLVEIARHHQVKSVNYSLGYDAHHFEREYNKLCPDKMPNEAHLTEMIRATNAIPKFLTEQAHVLFAQAAPYSFSPMTQQDREQNYAADCAPIPGRLRVAPANNAAFHLTTEASENLINLPHTTKNALPCSDILIRDGLLGDDLLALDQSSHPIWYSGFGIDHYRLNVRSTSWITPIALSMVHYAMAKEGISLDQIQTAFKSPQGLPKIYSPFATKRFFNQDPDYINYRTRRLTEGDQGD